MPAYDSVLDPDSPCREWYEVCRRGEQKMFYIGVNKGDRFETTSPLPILWECGTRSFNVDDELAAGSEFMLLENPQWNEGFFWDVIVGVTGRSGRALVDVYTMADRTRKTYGVGVFTRVVDRAIDKYRSF